MPVFPSSTFPEALCNGSIVSSSEHVDNVWNPLLNTLLMVLSFLDGTGSLYILALECDRSRRNEPTPVWETLLNAFTERRLGWWKDGNGWVMQSHPAVSWQTQSVTFEDDVFTWTINIFAPSWTPGLSLLSAPKLMLALLFWKCQLRVRVRGRIRRLLRVSFVPRSRWRAGLYQCLVQWRAVM